ncbi:beta-N-acetylhexosaminidase [Autumnicola musiva]|uniref:beta-N-acetylhexosaminidase n=1 Tax=Autumnicola musiva TaxID=3075589 RepID=A0ABU3D6M6_9FLAO|nr:beta-N-acetylhexosaminidase [Zunongwangia sp. F117]MDT0677187.1 beta-N-acetylhexosaminidase [Zunongwangia sp. F117]
MKPHKLLLAVIFLFTTAIHSQDGINVIPQPTKVEMGTGAYFLEGDVKLIAISSVKSEADYLASVLEKGFGKKPDIQQRGAGIALKIIPDLKDKLGEEGYTLTIKKNGVTIAAGNQTGIFYGIQSFRQLLPPNFEFKPQTDDIEIPAVKIADNPRFPWRSFHLDESRHFKGMKEVKKLLDQMALLKMNKFHWHLTDDQGWRIEIKKYPLLTEIGSKRKDTQISRNSDQFTGEPHSGFYTQEEIKEIIEYAKKRHITIVPEIEMPGHAMAAVAAYPWLGSLGTTKEVATIFGKMDDSFNISDPKVINFLKNVLDEVMALFPGEVIHIGGDEVNFEPWKNSESIQAFMKKEGLKSPVDLQIYFTNQISNYVDKAGKRMMGWNEIMGDDIHKEHGADIGEVEQKLAESAIVHFWKGELDLINNAVEEGYDVVNSNHWDTYLDYTYERIPLSRSYSFNPIPEGLDEKYHSKILGFGTQMWSEYIPTVAQMDQQIFPRLAAYAEVGWTSLSEKDFERFENSLIILKERWNLAGINYHEATE